MTNGKCQMSKLKCQKGKRAGGWRFEGGGGRQNVKVKNPKCQMTNA